MLSLISYNILLGKNIEKIFEWYLKCNGSFDIICFQEFPEKKITQFIPLLSKEYQYQFAPGIKIKGQIFGELTVFNSKRLTLDTTQAIYLGTSRIEKRLFKNDVERTALLTQFKHHDKKFLVANCHLTPFTHNKRRRNQLELIIAHIREEDHAIIVGDYNYPSIRQNGLIKFMEENKFESMAKNLKTHKVLFLKQQLDYFFQKNCTVYDIHTENIGFSDHFPLVVQFDII